MRGYCSVVDSIDCECPPQGMVGDPLPVTCFSCGNDVCKECSSLIPYRKHQCRICFDCQEYRKIGRSAPKVSAALL